MTERIRCEWSGCIATAAGGGFCLTHGDIVARLAGRVHFRTEEVDNSDVAATAQRARLNIIRDLRAYGLTRFRISDLIGRSIPSITRAMRAQEGFPHDW